MNSLGRRIVAAILGLDAVLAFFLWPITTQTEAAVGGAVAGTLLCAATITWPRSEP